MQLQPKTASILNMKSFPAKQTETAWILLVRTQQVLLEKVETVLKQADLPPLSWYDVLVELCRDPASGLRQYEIGERVLLNKHNLSRLIDRLEREKLLMRQVCKEDGRGNVIKITKKGSRLKEDMWEVYARVIQEMIGATLSNEQMRSLTDILKTLLDKNGAIVHEGV